MQSTRRQRGGAALEAMLLMPIILVILGLLMNMGYNGVRHRKAQAALRLGAFQYIDGLARTTKTGALQSAQGSVSSKMFPGESNPVKLTASGQSNSPADLPDTGGILSGASFRQAVGVEVTRDPPWDVFPDSPLKGSLVLAANTFTYCEMKDEDFDSVGQDALDGFSLVGDWGLWLFGGCGTAGGDLLDIGFCKDRCEP
jgi:hypothetical protein